MLATAVALAVTTFSAAAAGTPACTSSGTLVWFDTSGSGAAGSTYFSLEMTNLSGHTCTLSGYPGVSAVDLSGHQLGSPAIHDAVHKPAVITLTDGTQANTPTPTAIAVLRITNVGNYPAAKCRPTSAAGLRVYLPGQKASSIVPFPFGACTKSGPTFLSVQPIEGGAAG